MCLRLRLIASESWPPAERVRVSSTGSTALTVSLRNHGTQGDARAMSEIKILIHIDKHAYHVPLSSATGAQLRQVPSTAIGPNLDLYEEVPGAEDILILDNVTYSLKDGLHFFTAPATINPGRLEHAAR